MAFRTRGSRRIVVEGIQYLWQIRRRKTDLEELKITLAISARQKSSTALLIDLEQPYPNYWIDFKKPQVVLPNQVEAWIRKALLDGWQPLEAGKPFFLKETV
jgi:hypothetical protein